MREFRRVLKMKGKLVMVSQARRPVFQVGREGGREGGRSESFHRLRGREGEREGREEGVEKFKDEGKASDDVSHPRPILQAGREEGGEGGREDDSN